jgi:hypothetical protein
MISARHYPEHDLPGLDSRARPDPRCLSELITVDIDVASGEPPVPIVLWRVTDVDAAHGRTDARSITPQIAALLVAFYTRPGDTLVSVGNDPTLAGAAGASGRSYLSVQHPHELPNLAQVTGAVALIVLPWPPPDRPDPVGHQRLMEMFRTCQQLMSGIGRTTVTLAALPADETYIEHGANLIVAAREAGLGWSQHIIAISTPISDPRTTGATRTAPAAQLRAHLDLLVFSPGRFP